MNNRNNKLLFTCCEWLYKYLFRSTKSLLKLCRKKSIYIWQHNMFLSFSTAHISHGKYFKLFIFMAVYGIKCKQIFCFKNAYKQHISYCNRMQQRLVLRWPAKLLTSHHEDCRYASAFAKDIETERDSNDWNRGENSRRVYVAYKASRLQEDVSGVAAVDCGDGGECVASCGASVEANLWSTVIEFYRCCEFQEVTELIKI
jgi:hypothetical protein